MKSVLRLIRPTLTLHSLLRYSTHGSVLSNSDQHSSSIHPSAIVHPAALVGQDVSIGPFCTVGSAAKIGDGCHLYPGSHVFGNTVLGDRCVLMTGAVVGDDLPGHTVLGRNNVVGHHAVIGVKSQDMKYKFGDECFLEIGDNNEIREHASIHRSSKPSDKTVIGDNNLIMGSCHIAHDCYIGNYNIFANNTLLAGHVCVEDYTHTAGAIVVHQFCHIGSFSFIGGGSVVAQDVPRYAMVAGERAEMRGLNLEGLRRHGFTTLEPLLEVNKKPTFFIGFPEYGAMLVAIKSLRTAYRRIFMPFGDSSMGFEERLSEVEQDTELSKVSVVCSLVQSLRDSFAENRRGMCKFRNWSVS